MFEPSPQPLLPRTLSDRPIDEQAQSLFLARLPAEIRNEIYGKVFEGGGVWVGYGEEEEGSGTGRCSEPDAEPAPESDPLSLLLACRQINLEATTLAFSLHTFIVRREVRAFHALRLQTSLLSPVHISAITSLAYDTTRAGYSPSRGGPLIASALLLFPKLASIELRLTRGSGDCVSNGATRRGPDDMLPQRVMHWFRCSLMTVCEGRDIGSWGAGKEWALEWPQMDAPDSTMSRIETVYRDFGAARAEATMRDLNAKDYGIEPCVCGCGAPGWMRVVLVQETGRRVQVGVVYYTAWMVKRDLRMQRRRELAGHQLKLTPGAERLKVRTLDGKEAAAVEELRGFGWDGRTGEEGKEKKGKGVGWRRWRDSVRARKRGIGAYTDEDTKGGSVQRYTELE